MNAGQPRGWVECCVRTLDLAQGGQELATGAGVDPAPHLARVPQVPVFVHGDDQRAEILVRALSLEPASDDQLLLPPELDLQPRAGPAPRLVGAVPALGDDPLQFLLACGLPVGLDVWREVDHRIGPEHAAQHRLALVQRDVEQRLAVQVEQVEDPVDERNGGALLAGEGLGFWPSSTGGDLQPAQAGPLLQPAERWPAVLVERHDLAVNHRIARLDPWGRPGQVRKVGRRVLPVARPDARASLVDDRLDAIPVPLDLKEPVRRAEGRINWRCEHGRDEIGDGCLAGTLQLEDAGSMCLRLLRRVGELHSSRLHASTGQDLGLDHRWAADSLGRLARLSRRLAEAGVRTCRGGRCGPG